MDVFCFEFVVGIVRSVKCYFDVDLLYVEEIDFGGDVFC